MSNRVMLTSLVLSLTLMMACKSELDGKQAASVSEAEPAQTEPLAGEVPEVASTDLRQLTVDQEASKIEWLGAKITGTHKGGFHIWSGTVTVDEHKKPVDLSFEVRTESIYSDNERLTRHLRSDDFFDVENHPLATFMSTEISAGAADADEGTHRVTGNLSLRGVTKKLTFPATIEVEEQKLVAKADFKFNRMDFGVSYAGAVDDLIREDVALTVHFEAPLNESAAADAAE